MKLKHEQHCNTLWIELRFNSIQFKIWIKIQLKKNEMQMGENCIENLLLNTMLEKKLWKYTNIKRHLSTYVHLRMG